MRQGIESRIDNSMHFFVLSLVVNPQKYILVDREYRPCSLVVGDRQERRDFESRVDLPLCLFDCRLIVGHEAPGSHEQGGRRICVE